MQSGNLSVGVTSGLGDMAIAVFSGETSITGFNQTALNAVTGGSVTGEGDYFLMGEAIGEADNSVNFLITNSARNGCVVCNLEG